MPLRTSVRVSFTPIRRNQITLQSAAMIAAVKADLNGRADAVIAGARKGYQTSKPKYYKRTNNLGKAWKKKQDGVGVRVYNDVQGTNWSGETSRYAQFVYGTVTDPDRQGEWQQDWPLIYDLINTYFNGAARDRSLAYSRFLQKVMERHFK